MGLVAGLVIGVGVGATLFRSDVLANNTPSEIAKAATDDRNSNAQPTEASSVNQNIESVTSVERPVQQPRISKPEVPVPSKPVTIIRTDGSGKLPEGAIGIAAAYIKDGGIFSDEDVVFAEDFESYSNIEELSAKWNEVGKTGYIDLSSQAKEGIGGKRSLEMRIPLSEQSLGNVLAKKFDTKQDTVFVRYYTRFDSDFDLGLKFSHTSCAIYGSTDGQLSPGVSADGKNKLYAALMTYRDAREDDSVPPPGELAINLYSPEQRYEWGDKVFPTGVVLPNSSLKFNFGPDFVARPNSVPWRGHWYCRELMFKTNTPGKRNGRVAVWTDGKLIADFMNLRVRDVESLKLDGVRFGLYANKNDQREVKKWYDNIVIATSYIGPVNAADKSADPTTTPVVASTPTSKPTTEAPAPTPTSNPRPTPEPVVPPVRTEDIPDVTPTTLGQELVGFLTQHCNDCHSGSDPEGGLNLDSNAIALADPEVRRRWTYLYDRVVTGEMPPPEADQPNESSKQSFLRALGGVLTRADLDEREVVLRRLNRNEYTNTVSDLFGAYVEVSRILLDDSRDTGFDNVGSELSISKEQMQTYVEAADTVLSHVLGPEKQVESTVRTFNLATSKRSTVGSSEKKLADGIVLYSSGKHLPTYGFSSPIPGLYRYTVKVRAEQTQKPVVLHIWGGNTGQISRHSEGFFEAPVGQVKTIDLNVRAKEYGDNISFALMNGYSFSSVNVAEYKGPGVFIGDITIEGPIHEWDETRRRLLGNVNPETGTLNDVRAILQKVMPRAFRRPVNDSDFAPYLGLAKRAMDAGRGFEEAIRLGLQGVLCAPEFLYIEEPIEPRAGQTPSRFQTDRLNYILASRLSYFLWSSLPDNELMSLADRGQLTQPNVLRAQVDRMLADSKSQQLCRTMASCPRHRFHRSRSQTLSRVQRLTARGDDR